MKCYDLAQILLILKIRSPKMTYLLKDYIVDENEMIMDRITRVNNAVIETNKKNEVEINESKLLMKVVITLVHGSF